MFNKSIFGFNENLVAAFSYAFGWISGILVYIFEKENKTVRFHALQSTIFFLAASVVRFILGLIPILGGLALNLFGIAMLVAYIYLIYSAFSGKTFRIPIIGDAVYDQVNK